MEKRKRDVIAPEMRRRLGANRDGRLTVTQWLDMVTAPLLITLVLVAVALLVFRGRIFLVLARAAWIIVPALALVVVLPLVLRAIRYARTPIHCANLFAGVRVQPLWMFWRPTLFYTDHNDPMRFERQLAPPFHTHIDREYVVYYLDDGGRKVLLSAIPADHEDAEIYAPSQQFNARQARRAS